MASRRPLVLVSGFTSELPDGDSVIGISAGTVTAGSGLVNGGDVSSDIRLDVQLSPNPSGLIYIGTGDTATLGIDGAAQVAADNALASGNAALVDASEALASGNAALTDAATALASGNAALTDSSEALASGNAALSSADLRLLRSGDTATGQIQFTAGNAATPGIGVGDSNTGFYRSAADEVAITAGGAQVFKIDASGVATFVSTRAVDLPAGTTGQRPGGSNTGMVRYSTTSNALEVYTNEAVNWQTQASLERNQTFQRAQRSVISGIGVQTGSVTLDFNAANNFYMVAGGTITLNTPTNSAEGQGGVVYIQQDGTGSRTISFASEWEFTDGTAPTLTTTASGVDALVYHCRTASNITTRAILNLS